MNQGVLRPFLASKPNLEKNKYDYELFYTDGLMKKRALKIKRHIFFYI